MNARRTVALACWLALGCGGAGSDGNYPDAGPGTCDLKFSVSPVDPVAPTTFVASASVARSDFYVGVETFSWSASFGGNDVAVTARDADGRQVEIAASAAGTYRVVLSGSVGDRACTDALEMINVRQPGANAGLFRLRMYPAAGQGAPVQQRVVEIAGGADFALGTISLETGVPVAGTVRTAAGDALPAFLRLDKNGALGWPARELFADATGAFSTRVASGTYDVLVVPTSAGVAPALITAATVTELSSIQLTTGVVVDGTVVDGSGTAMEGASVSLRAGGVPSTIATTTAGGAFTLLAQPGSAAVVVRPPGASGLPRLVLGPSAGFVVASGSALAVSYATTTVRAFDLDVTAADGTTAAPGAQVTFVARSIASAGTITPAGGSLLVAAGEYRITISADGAGTLTGVRLPEAVYDVIIAQPSGSDTTLLASIDLTAGMSPPTRISLASAGTVRGVVRDTLGTGLASVRVIATPRGLLAGVPGAASSALTDADGQYSLSLVAGGDYALTLVPSQRNYGRQALTVTAPAAGSMVTMAPVALPDAIEVTGDVTIPGVAGASGVYLQLLCYDCVGAAATAPVAEAVSDASGRFSLSVPDPGTGE